MMRQCVCGHTDDWHYSGSCELLCDCAEFVPARRQASFWRRYLAALLGVQL